MDFRRFKKIKEDQDTATLQHPDGHQIRIAKKVLPTKMQGELQALPMHLYEGDQVEPNASYQPGEEPKQQPQAPVTINIGGAALGQQPISSPAPEPQQPQVPLAQRVGQHLGNSVRTAVSDTYGGVKTLAGAVANPVIQAGQGFVRGIEGDQPQEQDSQAPVVPAVDQNAGKLETLKAALAGGQQGQEQPMPQGPDFSQGMNMFREGLQGQLGPKGAIQQEATAQQNLNTQQGKTYEQAIQKGQDLQTNIDQIKNQMASESDAFTKDMQNQHIDPLRWWHQKSSGSKIMAGIGMLIGGMGSGLLHQDPLDFVNKMIDNDINAQKEDIGIKKSIYDANMNKFKNSNMALDMTRLNMNQMVQHMISQTAAKYGNPVIQAKANQMINSLKMDASSKLNEMAMRQAMMSNMANPSGGSDQQIAQRSQMLRMMGQKDMADSIDKRHVPGIGLAQIEVTPDVRGKLVNGKILDDAIVDLQNFAKKNGSTVSKLTPALRNEASAKARRVQDLYRQANNQGVFREAEKEFVENSIKTQPLSFFSDWLVKPGLENTRQQNLQSLDELKSSVGLPKTYRAKSATKFTGE